MSRSIAQRHLLRALSRWPTDPLRPDTKLQDVLRHRLEQTAARDDGVTSAQANALYSLLENRYTHKYRLTPAFMKPASNPQHYEILVKELEEAPSRGLWDRMKNKMKNIVRF